MHDSQVVEDILNTPRSPLAITADKAYDSAKVRQQIKDEGALPTASRNASGAELRLSTRLLSRAARAQGTIEALKSRLAIRTSVRRDGRWIHIAVTELVPDDLGQAVAREGRSFRPT